MSSLCFAQAATKLLDEMCHLTAQSLATMDTSEHFKVLKLMGEGSYGKVMLAVHRKRGKRTNKYVCFKKRFLKKKLYQYRTLVLCRHSNGFEVFPTWVHLSFHFLEGVQPCCVILHPPVPDKSPRNCIPHPITLCLCSASRSLRWPFRCDLTWGTQLSSQVILKQILGKRNSFNLCCPFSTFLRSVWRRIVVSGWYPSYVVLWPTCTLLVLSTEMSNQRMSFCATLPVDGSNLETLAWSVWDTLRLFLFLKMTNHSPWIYLPYFYVFLCCVQITK